MSKRLSSVALAVVMMLAMFLPAAHADTVMYVYTENGKTLNVRKSERVEDNVVGQLAYGTPVTVRFIYNGWAEILYPWGDFDSFYVDYAYVQARYLVSQKPAPKPAPNPTAKPTAKPGPTAAPGGGADAAQVLADMNREFKSGKKVTPFVVVARPSRASGWVNLRWAPTTEAERITTCAQGKELLVLAELNNWYQVQDPETGLIGFISRKYVSVK